jgi:hypothetical protein
MNLPVTPAEGAVLVLAVLATFAVSRSRGQKGQRG